MQHSATPEREVSAEERDRILDRAAREVTRRRLETPAILALEMHRPLTFLGSQAVIVFTPLLAPAFGVANLERLSVLLADPKNLDRLLERIEHLVTERDAGEPGSGGACEQPTA